MDEIILTWGQTINGFNKQIIQEATGNVYNIKDRILNLKQRLELVNDPAQIAKIERNLKMFRNVQRKYYILLWIKYCSLIRILNYHRGMASVLVFLKVYK